MNKPTAAQRKILRARLQHELLAFWSYTERQYVNRKVNGVWEDTQSKDVIGVVGAMRTVLDDIERAYR